MSKRARADDDPGFTRGRKNNRVWYDCNICDKYGTCKRGRMTAHIRTHSGIKLYTCSECNDEFVQKGNLKRHKQHNC